MKTSPKQAASESWLDRAKRKVQAAITALDAEDYDLTRTHLANLLTSIRKAEKR